MAKTKLGDEFSKLTKFLGIRECDSCAQRRTAMNEIDTDASWAEILQGLSAVFLDEGTPHGGKKVDEQAGSGPTGEGGSESEGSGKSSKTDR